MESQTPATCSLPNLSPRVVTNMKWRKKKTEQKVAVLNAITEVERAKSKQSFEKAREANTKLLEVLSTDDGYSRAIYLATGGKNK